MRRREMKRFYSRMGIKKGTCEFGGEENIPDGDRAFSGVSLGPGNYDGEIRDIFILPWAGKHIGRTFCEVWAILITLRIGGIRSDCSDWET